MIPDEQAAAVDRKYARIAFAVLIVALAVVWLAVRA
jgi:hypothetical protein